MKTNAQRLVEEIAKLKAESKSQRDRIYQDYGKEIRKCVNKLDFITDYGVDKMLIAKATFRESSGPVVEFKEPLVGEEQIRDFIEWIENLLSDATISEMKEIREGNDDE